VPNITIAEVYGAGLSDLEYLERLDKDWLAATDVTVPWIASSGKFSIWRSGLNDRGETSSRMKLMRSVEMVGVQLDQREVPSLIQHPDPSVHDEYRAPTWATLSEAMFLAMLRDSGKTSRPVQISLKNGLKRCKTYRRDMPPWGEAFLKRLGNQLTDVHTATTCLEKWRQTASVTAAFSRKALTMGWNSKSMSQRQLDERKYEVASGMYAGMYQDYTMLERGTSFFRESQKLKIDVDKEVCGIRLKDKTVWEVTQELFMKIVDNSSIASAHSKIFYIAYEAHKVLRWDHPAYIVAVIALACPKLVGRWGVCSFVPQGLPLLQTLNTAKLQLLVCPVCSSNASMASTEPSSSTAKGGGAPKTKPKPQSGVKKEAKGKILASRKKQMEEKRKDSLAQLVLEMDTAAETGVGQTLLKYWESQEQYMLKLDGRQSGKVIEFFMCFLFSILNDVLPTGVKSADGKESTIKSWNTLRKLMKNEIYKAAKLAPRPSDVDFGDYNALEDQLSLEDEPQAIVPRDDEILEAAMEFKAEAGRLSSFVQSNQIYTLPVVTHGSYGAVVNQTMLATLTHMNTVGGSLQSQEIAAALLAEKAVEQIVASIPIEWLDVAL